MWKPGPTLRTTGIPFVWHGDDVAVEKVCPFAISAELSLLRRRWLCGIAGQPLANWSSGRIVCSKAGRRNPGAQTFFASSSGADGINRVVKLVRFFIRSAKTSSEASK